jgi:hypothetical protein
MPAIITGYQDNVTGFNAEHMNLPLFVLDQYVAMHHNRIFSCDGDITYNKVTGQLSWSGTIRILFTTSAGLTVENVCLVSNIVLADNEYAYFDLSETNATELLPGTAVITTGAASTSLPALRMVLGYRNATSDKFFPVGINTTFTSAGVLNNYDGTVNPTPDDDAGDGYSAGSLWVNTTNDQTYTCVDATTSLAIWVLTADGDNIVLDNLDAIVDPTPTDDSGEGYSIGSKWVNTATDTGFFCYDVTVDAARWEEIITESTANFLALSDTPSTYTGSAGKVAVVNGAGNGIEFVAINNIGGGSFSMGAYEYTATADQVLFTGADDNIATLDLDGYSEMVIVNGVHLSPDEYTRTNTSITLDTPVAAGKDVTIWAINGQGDTTLNNRTAIVNPVATNDGTEGYIIGSQWINTVELTVFTCVDITTDAAIWTSGGGAGGGGVFNVGFYEFTAGTSQTLFSGADDNAETLNLLARTPIVVVDGVLRSPDEYSYTDNTVTLVNPAPIGADVTIFGFNGNSFAVPQEWTATQNFDATTLVDGANIAWDLEANQVTGVTLAGNRTLDNPTNMKDGATYILHVIQDATGSRFLSYGSAYDFGDVGPPTLSGTGGLRDILTFVCGGTKMYGVASTGFGA